MIQSGEATMDWARAKDWLDKSTGPKNPRERLIRALQVREQQAHMGSTLHRLFKPTGISRSRTHWS